MYYLSILAGVSFYLLLVRVLRYRRRYDIQHRFPYKTREEMASMSLSEASTVMRELALQEFPIMFYGSVSFALFKTYGIPTISKLLVATSQLSGEATASKRRTDTGVLMSEIMQNKPECPRNIEAIARVNFLHSRWRQAGKISNGDMLYTLCLFVLEPLRWVATYEWRDLTLLEKNAMAVFWSELGREMEISYDCLVPYMDNKDDPLAWLEALRIWSGKYQEEHMVYAVPNEKLAHANVNLLLMDVPRFARSFVFGQVLCLMEPILRRAMGYEDPTNSQTFVFNTMIAARRWTIKHLCLPRPAWWTFPYVQEADKKTGRFFARTYLAHPYYVKPTAYSRWGPGALYSRMIGGKLPGDEGCKYYPDGYLISEVGPDAQRGKGKDFMDLQRDKIGKARGCPMAFGV
ncbi:hypothetical protein CPLU01_07603 [Colletotrichum plurivorum]|uniref:ER-bound oxygenase mpaB/mpaB'/Rubber oxygenase catalytic domain-containing protein n=1 Tax=Colletotrichum plurivorum TaxID=2175906 RepID=A0A8H6KFF4_9PEZI|nr:hypothetical protein CPLU01_07603 [Colletotrichum plurivorum]